MWKEAGETCCLVGTQVPQACERSLLELSSPTQLQAEKQSHERAPVTPCGAWDSCPGWATESRAMKGLPFKPLRFGCFVTHNRQRNPTHLSKIPPPYFPESSRYRHLSPVLWHEASPWPPSFHFGDFQTIFLRTKGLEADLRLAWSLDRPRPPSPGKRTQRGPACKCPMTRPLGNSLTSALTSLVPVHSAAATLTFLLVLGDTPLFFTPGTLSRFSAGSLCPWAGSLSLRSQFEAFLATPTKVPPVLAARVTPISLLYFLHGT